MVIVKLIGGLGNQMFQYATGRAVAYRNDTELKIDKRAFKDYDKRDYKLHNFNITASSANEKEIKRLRPSTMSSRVKKLLGVFPTLGRARELRQSKVDFEPEILQAGDEVYLDGYWQSEEYFKDIEGILRQEFTLKEKLSLFSQKKLKKIQSKNSVSIHIRRGDYVKKEETKRVHGVLGLDYYQKAVRYLEDRVDHPEFFVFSDGIDWAKKNLDMGLPINFMDHKCPDYEDLILMSHCEHNIIANSSFSWWGAWLNSNTDNIVIAPKRWFISKEMSERDVRVVPERWIQL